MARSYVHGYDAREAQRLRDQADTLVALLHGDTHYAAGSEVLEVGCGTGAQTVTLATRNPEARFTAIDMSEVSLAAAEAAVQAAGVTNVRFQQADLFAPPFAARSIDHVFVCFVLEHLAHPIEALIGLRRLLRGGGTMTVIEGDHGSAYFHPDSAAARAVIECQVALQRGAGGNAMIGRQLYPMMVDTGLRDVRVSPRMVYVDGSQPGLADAFTRQTFTAMIEGVRGAAIEAGLMDAAAFEQGLQDLRRTAEADGVFCYTFFKGTGVAGSEVE